MNGSLRQRRVVDRVDEGKDAADPPRTLKVDPKTGATLESWVTPGSGLYGNVTTPSGARGITSVVAGNEHVAAITGTGRIVTWGQDSHYQTGRGRGATAPGLVRAITGVSSVAAGGESTIAVLGSGQMMTWGHVPGGYGRFPIPLVLDGLVAASAAVR